jgi:hypothetical protein
VLVESLSLTTLMPHLAPSGNRYLPPTPGMIAGAGYGPGGSPLLRGDPGVAPDVKSTSRRMRLDLPYIDL